MASRDIYATNYYSLIYSRLYRDLALSGNEAEVDLVLIQTSLFFYVSHVVLVLTRFTYEMQEGLYENRVNFSLTSKPSHCAHDCKMV